jgi:hypothetical protein
LLPFLSEWPQIELKTPGLGRLLRKKENGFRYLCGFQKKIVWLVRHPLSRPLQIDDSIEYHVADMDSFGTREALNKSPLARPRLCGGGCAKGDDANG